MKHANAMIIARDAWAKLKPHCSNCKIAGSLRRKKPEVKDIEIVACPNTVENEVENPDLFDPNTVKTIVRAPGFIDTVYALGKVVKGKPETGKQVQILTPEGMIIDLFITRPENWGYILTIRTGSGDFSKALFTRARHLKYHGEDGMLRDPSGRPVDIPTEEAYFQHLRMRMPDPKDRELGPQGLKPWIIY